MTAQLNGHIPNSDRDILSGDIDFFHSNVTTIADSLSTQLIVITEYLSKIANPKSPPAISNLSRTAADLYQTAYHDLPHDLSTAQSDLANTAVSYLATHRQLLETSIRILEQTQHGSLARRTKSSAELLHTKATLLGLQAKIHTISRPPPAEFVAALKEFKKQQGSGEKALRDREAIARKELELYERAGGKVMRDLAKRKAVLMGEIKRVEGEVRKLEGGR